jgi:uncharacterized membrane protein YkoI
MISTAKKISLLLIGCLCSFALAYGQDLKESDVPLKVRETFKSLYPDTYVYEWEWEKKKGLYEAEFILKGKKHEGYFAPDGTWKKTTQDIKKHEVPEAIWRSIGQSAYAGWEIDDTEIHHTPQHKVVYEIEVKQKKQKVKLYYLPDGTPTE